MKIVVLGAGPLGLSFAKEMTDKGQKVFLVDAGEVGGGLAQPQEFDGMLIDRFYHFYFWKDSSESENFLNRTDPQAQIFWSEVSSSTYFDKSFHDFDNLLSVLKLSGSSFLKVISAIIKLKLFPVSQTLDWMPAAKWATEAFGKKFAEAIWIPLLDDRFGRHSQNVSALWLATRIKRHLSTKVGFPPKCRFGYLEQTYKRSFENVLKEIKSYDGKIFLNSKVSQVKIEDNRVTAIRLGSGNEIVLNREDILVSTIPLASLKEVLKPLPENLRYLEKFKAIGVVIVALSLEKKLSDDYWTTVADQTMPFKVVIQQNRLFPKGPRELVYLSKYFTEDSEIAGQTNDEIFKSFFAGLKKMYPHLNDEDVRSFSVSRSSAGAPIPEKNMLNLLPPFQSTVSNFYHAGFEHTHPKDRGVGNSISLGRELAEHLQAKGVVDGKSFSAKDV